MPELFMGDLISLLTLCVHRQHGLQFLVRLRLTNIPQIVTKAKALSILDVLESCGLDSARKATVNTVQALLFEFIILFNLGESHFDVGLCGQFLP